MGSSGSEMHGSPQAVFTSFKLPKPGSMDMHLPMQSPFGLGNRFPVPVSYFQTSTTSTCGITTTPRVMTAPLGGLPAVDSQMAARQQQQAQQQHQQVMKMMSQQPTFRHLSSPDRISDDGDDCRSLSPKSPPATPKPVQPKSSESGEVKQEGNSSDESPPKSQGLIKARGTYYPLTAFPTSMPQGPVMRRDDSPPRTELQSGWFTNFIQEAFINDVTQNWTFSYSLCVKHLCPGMTKGWPPFPFFAWHHLWMFLIMSFYRSILVQNVYGPFLATAPWHNYLYNNG